MRPPCKQEFVSYWLSSYDWRQWEARLNSFSQYTQTIEGVDLHYLHEPSPNKDAVPLLLLHGWPGSFFEFYKLIPLLKETRRFHIVAPSLPGGCSSGSDSTPWLCILYPQEGRCITAALLG